MTQTNRLTLTTLLLCLFLSPFFSFAEGPGKTTRYVESLSTMEQFQALKGRPNTSKFGQVEAVKIAYDLSSEQLYFFDSDEYKYHYHFCKEVLKCTKSNYQFNLANYTTTHKRDYYLATLNHHTGRDLYTLEFSVGDEITLDQIEAFYALVTANFYAGEELKVFLNTAKKVELFAEADHALPTITADEIYAGQTYQPLNNRTTFGYLKFIEVDKIDDAQPGMTDIVLLNGTVETLPVTAGLITTEFQTPLSHLNVLCHNRNTPMMAFKSAFTDSTLLSLSDKLVRLEVLQDTFLVRPAQLEEAESFWAAARPKNTIHLVANREVKTLVDMADINARSTDIVGGKAANFGELTKVKMPNGTKLTTPEGAFAIPFHFYLEHIEHNDIDLLIQGMLNDPAAQTDQTVLKAHLKRIQKAIKNAPMDPDLVFAIESKILDESPSTRMRFRSSTNAEDIPGFNGAGLYTSKTGIVGHEKKTVERAVKKVWASAWNYAAYRERDYFRIDQEQVAMGILVHRGFPDEDANGVAITKNLYRPSSSSGFVINVQAGETSVVSPPSGVTCDQLICYANSKHDFYKKKDIVEYLSYSSENEGQPVLSTDQVVELTQQLTAIKKHYHRKVGKKEAYKDFAMDVEFKFEGDRLYIKQARVFNN